MSEADPQPASPAAHPRAAAPPPPAARGVRRVGACPVCELSQQPRFAEHVRGWRTALLGRDAPARVEVGVAACSHHCNHTLVHEIAVVARRHGYSIAVGGKGDGIPRVAEWLVEGIPADRVQPVLEHVLAAYGRLARGRERLSRVVARVGVEPFCPPGLQAEFGDDEQGPDRESGAGPGREGGGGERREGPGGEPRQGGGGERRESPGREPGESPLRVPRRGPAPEAGDGPAPDPGEEAARTHS